MRTRLMFSFVLFLVLAISASFIHTDKVNGASKQTLTVSRVKTVPSGLDDAVWGKTIS